ncbi:DRTGG domain-containing protein [Mycobacterium lepromatosis]|uniref:DRTGG domain-containing protein n=2 Tax=Mycobacterium lepromatosis TaxID=480418 RepID=UPI0006791374|nr:DRTGG domain-containing protein [Mycobacterium lepromatosis]
MGSRGYRRVNRQGNPPTMLPERQRDGMVVITPGDCSDVVLAITSSHFAEGFPEFSCIILNGEFELQPLIV